MKFIKSFIGGSIEKNKCSNPSVDPEKNLKTESLIDILFFEDLKKQWIYPTTYSEENDVFIASYPKSGVTWLRHMTGSLVHGMDASKTPNIIINTLFPDLHKLKYYLRTNKISIFKTHDLPRPEMKKVVHLVRDGRDVMTSYHAMLSDEGYNISLDNMINNSEGLYPCDWSTHCKEWLRNPYKAQILKISYEELINNTEETLVRYCEFLGVDADRDLINETVQKSSFSNMKKKEIEQGWGPLHNPLKKGMFVRRGKIKSYFDEMPKGSIIQFEKLNSDVLNELGYKLSGLN